MIINSILRGLSFLIFELDSPSERCYFQSETYVTTIFVVFLNLRWNDFYCYMLIMQEDQDIEIEGASEFLSKKNCFNNQSLM